MAIYSRIVKKRTIKCTCFHFLPYLLQPDTFTRSVLMWKKENLFAFMGKAYYFRYSAFAMVNTYWLAQWEQRFSNVSFVFLLTNQQFQKLFQVKFSLQGRKQFKKLQVCLWCKKATLALLLGDVLVWRLLMDTFFQNGWILVDIFWGWHFWWFLLGWIFVDIFWVNSSGHLLIMLISQCRLGLG